MTRIQAFDSGALNLKDFYFTGDDYRYHVEVEAKRRFLELLKSRFHSGVKYNGKTCKWDMVILNKTRELTRFLLGKSESLNFAEPTPKLERTDSQDLRELILALSIEEAGKLGIRKSTLHSLRQRAIGERPLTIYKRVASRLLEIRPAAKHNARDICRCARSARFPASASKEGYVHD